MINEVIHSLDDEFMLVSYNNASSLQGVKKMNAMAKFPSVYQAIRSDNSYQIRLATIYLINTAIATLRQKDASGEGVKIARILLRDLREVPPIEYSDQMMENFKLLRLMCRSVGAEILAGQCDMIVREYSTCNPVSWPFWTETKTLASMNAHPANISAVPTESETKMRDRRLLETMPACKKQAA